MITKTKIVQIGNSKGIRVPKVLLEHAQLPDEVELQAEQRPADRPGGSGAYGQDGPRPQKRCTLEATINFSMPRPPASSTTRSGGGGSASAHHAR